MCDCQLRFVGGGDIPDDEDRLAWSDEAELAAGDFLDGGRIFPQPTHLFAEPGNDEGRERLKTLVRTTDGFALAEADVNRISGASGIVADDQGTIYAADVGPHKLRKYVKVK